MHKLLYNSIAVSLRVPGMHALKNRLLQNLAIPGWIRALLARDTVIALVFFTLSAASLAFLYTAANNALLPSGSHDFMWTPAKTLVAGDNPYAEFIAWKEAGNKHTPPHFLNQSPSYPASVIMLFTPLAALDWPTAKLFWLTANMIFLALLLSGLQKSFPITKPAVLAFVALVFLCSTPLRASLGAGQHNFLSLAAFFWAYYFSNKEDGANPTLAGLLLSIAWVKYSLTFPLTLLFIARGNWKPVVIAAIVHSLLTAAAAFQMGLWPHEFFFSSVEVVLMGDGVGFLNLVALSMNLQLPLSTALFAISIASAYALWLLPRHKASDDLLLLTFLGLFSCAVFYHHGYDFIVLILCVWAMARGSIRGKASILCGTLVALAWCGQWMANEISPFLGAHGYHAVQFIDYLLIASFYGSLIVLWNQQRNRQNQHSKSLIAVQI